MVAGTKIKTCVLVYQQMFVSKNTSTFASHVLKFRSTCHIDGEERRQGLLVNVKGLLATEMAPAFIIPWKVSSRLNISYNAGYTVCVNVCRNIMGFIFVRFRSFFKNTCSEIRRLDLQFNIFPF